MVAALASLLLLALAGCGEGPDEPGLAATGPLPNQGGLLFVVRGEATVEGERLELKATDVVWFTDRPKRRAGIALAEELVEKWDAYGFGEDPPNAEVSGPDTEAVVELSEPEAGDDALSFAFKPIQGNLGSADGDQLSAFIDSTFKAHKDSPTQVPPGTPIGD